MALNRADIRTLIVEALAAETGRPVTDFKDTDDLRKRWHLDDRALRALGARLQTELAGTARFSPADVAACRTLGEVVDLVFAAQTRSPKRGSRGERGPSGHPRGGNDFNDRMSTTLDPGLGEDALFRHADPGTDDRLESARPSAVGAEPPDSGPTPVGRVGQPGDTVDMAAYGPKTFAPGGTVLVQAILHQPADADAARALAQEADADARRRGVQTLALPLARGDRVTIDLDVAGVTIDEPRQAAVWNGAPVNIQFFVAVPADHTTPLAVRLTASRDSVPVGTIRFLVPVQAGAAPGAPEPRGEALRFSRAFISYTTADRPDVLERVQMLDLAGITVFQDVLSLEPGERWEKRLYEKIAEADLFVLFWSPRSSQSQWVLKEALYALECGTRPPGERPHIMPVVLGGLPMPSVPPELGKIHFNDKFNYLIAGAQAEAERRRATRASSAPPPAGP